MPALSQDLALASISSNWTTIILIAMFVLGLVLVVSVPIIIDVLNAHRSWREIVEKHPATLAKLPTPTGVDGLARATMALGLLVAIGFGLAYMLVQHPFDDNKTIITAILSALTTAFASVTAFYFGTRAVQAGVQADNSSGTSSGTLTVTITSPPDGASFTTDEVVNAAFSAVPSTGAAITVLSGTVDNGAPLDTAEGEKMFTVKAEDSAGQKTTVTHTYTVTPPAT